MTFTLVKNLISTTPAPEEEKERLEREELLTTLTYDVSRLVSADVSQQIFEIDVLENLTGILVNNINYLLLCQSGNSILTNLRVRPLKMFSLR